MDNPRHDAVKELLERVLATPAGHQRDALLNDPAIDSGVRREVRRLLAADERAVAAGKDRSTGASAPTTPIAPVPEPLSATTPSPAAPADPESIGPYRVLRRLGGGGMGMVYLCVRDDEQIKRRVAVKLIKKGMDSEAVLKRFELEKQVLGTLSHPNIARVLDAGMSADNRPYFVMEFVEGQTLLDYSDSNQLPIADRLRLFMKVCTAVHAAHQNLIVHRDIKPGNIIVGMDGEPKLLDFGIAKLLNPSLAGGAGIDVFTAEFQRLMTPEYASPEQVKGDPITTASDVYSLGVLLYELLTGIRPYGFKTRLHGEIVRVINEEEPRRPSYAIADETQPVTQTGTAPSSGTGALKTRAKLRSTRPDTLRRELSNDLDDIVLMAMRKSPKRRYASAEQMAEDIRRHLTGQTVIARPETASYVIGKFIRRNRLAVATAAAVLLLLAGSTAVVSWKWRDEAIARAQAEQARHAAAQARDQTLDVVKGYFRSVLPSIRNLPGGHEAERRAAEQIIQTFGSAIGDPEPGNRLLRVQLGRAYDQLGLVLGGLESASEGDRSGALAAAQKSVEILDKCAQEDRTDVEALVNLSWALQHLGNIHMLRVEPDLALAAHQRAVEVGMQAVQVTQPGSDKRGRAAAAEAHALAVHKVAERSLATGDLAGARRLLEATVAPLMENSIAMPDNATMQRNYAVVFTKLAQCATSDADGLELNRRALAIREKILERWPGTAMSRRDAAITRERVGMSLVRLNRCDEALPMLRAAFTEIDELQRVMASDTRTAWDAVRIRTSLGAALACTRAVAEAQDHARRALESASRLPRDLQGLEAIAEASELLAELSAPEAPAALARAREAWSDLATRDPKNTGFARRLANVEERLRTR